MMVLDVVPAGSAWNRTAAFWSSQADDKKCKHCGEEEDKPDHIWTCKALQKGMEEADADLASLNPKALPMAINCGIAPTTKANIKGPFLGKRRGG